MISVIIPLYNKEKQIRQTLESVLAQTFQDFEVLVVNDGSTDNSIAVLNEIKDNRIRLIQQENQGVSAARNKGIQAANYDYIALLDADDEWKPEYLATQVDLIQRYPECAVYACAYEFKDYHGNIKSLILNKIPFTGENGILSNYFEVASCSHPPICSINIVAKKTAFLAIGGFPVGIKAGEDLLTWARLAVNNQIAYSRKILVSFNDEGEKARRIPDTSNQVSTFFIALEKDHPSEYLRQYIALWFRMRCFNYMFLGKNKLAWKELVFSSRYHIGKHTLLYVFLLLIPYKFRESVYNKLKNKLF